MIQEIKKALYKEKPVAICFAENEIAKYYRCELKDYGKHEFHVPWSDMGDKPFEDELPAQLLIRWLK